jgi:glyoxylase-like metal-dependent hydrolase (beta-lactamase superfamily II)
MEIAPGLHCVETIHGDRLLNQYMFLGESIVLVDAGSFNVPEEVIFPYLRSVGRDPAEIGMVVITHGDVDHFGGLGAIRVAAPRAVFLAHRLDADWIADPALVVEQRYDRHRPFGVDYGKEMLVELRRLIGTPARIDLALAGGETIFPWPDRPLQVFHVPGHTPGQLCLYDPACRLAIVSDAVTGRAQTDRNGRPTTPPYYYHRDQYLASIRTLEGLEAETLLTSHYPALKGAQAARFLQDSRAFAEDLDQAILTVLRCARKPLPLPDLIPLVAPIVGPYENAIFLAECLRAHLEALTADGKTWRGMINHIPAWTLKA